MCLSIPSKVLKVDKQSNTATLDTMGVQREASLMLMEAEDIRPGDYVLLHIGFVMRKIDEDEALASLELYEEMVQKINDEEPS